MMSRQSQDTIAQVSELYHRRKHRWRGNSGYASICICFAMEDGTVHTLNLIAFLLNRTTAEYRKQFLHFSDVKRLKRCSWMIIMRACAIKNALSGTLTPAVDIFYSSQCECGILITTIPEKV